MLGAIAGMFEAYRERARRKRTVLGEDMGAGVEAEAEAEASKRKRRV